MYGILRISRAPVADGPEEPPQASTPWAPPSAPDLKPSCAVTLECLIARCQLEPAPPPPADEPAAAGGRASPGSPRAACGWGAGCCRTRSVWPGFATPDALGWSLVACGVRVAPCRPPWALRMR